MKTKNTATGRWLKNAAGALLFGLLANPSFALSEKAGETAAAFASMEPLKITRMVQPIYPTSMTLAGVLRGDVGIVFGVDAQGKLDDCMVISHSRKEFADEVEKAIKQWTFSPARVEGSPIWSRAYLEFSFEASGVVVTRTVMDSISMLGGEMIERTYRTQLLSRQSELDRPLVVKQSVPPVYPAQLVDKKISGTVMVEFFVDEEGRVRLPVVDGDAHPWFGDAAAQAVLQWRFEPPMKKGRPAIVQVKQQFVFNP